MEKPSKWVRLATAAKELGVSYQTAWKWVNAGLLKTRRTPNGRGCHMVLRSDMERLYR